MLTNLSSSHLESRGVVDRGPPGPLQLISPSDLSQEHFASRQGSPRARIGEAACNHARATSGVSAPVYGGGNAGTASGTCASITGSTSAQAAISASSTTMITSSSTAGLAGISIGSTEFGVGGLSPMPQILNLDLSAPTSTAGTPCLTAGTADIRGDTFDEQLALRLLLSAARIKGGS